MTRYSIYSWNVNGLRAAVRKGMVDWLQTTQPDVLCLQEIKAEKEQFPKKLINLPYYLNVHSAERKGYSGVATLSKPSPEEIVTSIDHEEFDAEGRVLMTRYPEFILFNVYFPNGKKNAERLDYKMRFYHHFQQLCESYLQQGEKLVICGDVNTAHKEQDLAHPKPNAKYSGFLPQERAWIDEFLAAGFIDTFREIHGDGEGDYSWWSMRSKTARQKNVGWRLDYFYISDNLRKHLVEAEIHRSVQGSDHCPVSITLEI